MFNLSVLGYFSIANLALFAAIIAIILVSIGLAVFFRHSLSTKIAAVVVAVIACFIFAISYFTTEATYNRLKKEARDLSQLKVDAVNNELVSTDRSIVRQTRASMRVLQREGLAIGAPSLGGSVQVGNKTVSNLFFGNTPQANNFALVDQVKQLMGGTATLFVRNGDEFVRVTTNVQKDDGTRAVGTVLDPNGKAIAAIRQGQPFYGLVRILDKPYITGYEPIENKNKEIIGVWYVGYLISSLEEFADLKEYITNEKILDNGFLSLLDEKGEIVFNSANTSQNVLSEAVRSQTDVVADEWNVQRSEFAPWGYKIVAAYSDNDPQITGQILSQRLNIFAASLAFLIALSILTVWLMQHYLRPLSDAARAANEIAQGNVNAPLDEVKSDDEVGKMVGAMRGMSTYLQEMSGAADQIANGNLNVAVQPRSDQDRFGNAFKNMLERTLRHIQTQEERDQLQRSIMKLLEEVSDVANGDLTAEAEVTADATGAIADAFNFMIVELRNIIGQVKQTSLQVDNSASDIRLTTEDLMSRSESQSARLLELSATFAKMTSTMEQVAQDTNISARVSDAALTNAKQGTVAVQKNIESMSRLRSRVQETGERVKRLGERSQEISSIVKIINDLAQRTSVLALNASIQATAAGQQGRGFVAVAEEVERLAERSATASKQIDVLTKAIQGETNEAIAAMEMTVKEVAVGVKLTGEVGETLGEIEMVTNQIANISHEIAVAARQQAQDSTEISTAMNTIASVSQATAVGMKGSAETVNQLTVWAQELRSSVSSFRLPETDEELSTNGANTAASASNGNVQAAYLR